MQHPPPVSHPLHPLATRARVLLSSVFGPYSQDDEYGSRKINPMELYQNQVTRLQGGFSLRMFHRSFGLMMIQANIDAPCTLLDFPTLERFREEIRQQSYNVIGISGIIANVGKVAKMCELIRQYQPGATIVVGGHVANKEGLDQLIDADLIVRGEGIRWFQRYLGQDDQAPIKHPMALSGFGSRIMGVDLGDSPDRTAAILIPSVGCPLGCNFCSTSALFGGKG
ncbi:MAG: cobalamin-dependent protein, partial [Geobacteraceae bacterium]